MVHGIMAGQRPRPTRMSRILITRAVGMALMVEHVQERTCQKQQVGKRAQGMGTMLGQQEHADDGNEADENDGAPRSQPAGLTPVSVHVTLPRPTQLTMRRSWRVLLLSALTTTSGPFGPARPLPEIRARSEPSRLSYPGRGKLVA